MQKNNEMKLTFLSKSANETLARNSLASFITYLDPPLSTINELKTAISEVVTNSIIHGYDRREDGIININAEVIDKKIVVDVIDNGIGMNDINAAVNGEIQFNDAKQTAGMGFQIVKAFVNKLEITTSPGSGTVVHFEKEIV